MKSKNFLQYKTIFDTYIGARSEPDAHDSMLMSRAERYIRRMTWIPGLRMVAVVNSVSMHATHEGSDIDLFIITARSRMWLVRVLVTSLFYLLGVWRKGEDIAGNFCLSFFIEETALDMSRIAIEDDVYLYFWMYSLRPIYVVGDTYDRFRQANPDYIFREKNIPIHRHTREYCGWLWYTLDRIVRYWGERRTRSTYLAKWKPSWVIIAPDILKFHDMDRRVEIRDAILGT